MLDIDYSPKWYILDEDNNPIRTNDYDKIEEFLGSGRKITAQTEHRGYLVSTVFLGLDHAMPWNESAPQLWETMIFRQGDHSLEEFCCRYPIHSLAVLGHQAAINCLEEKINSGELPEYERLLNEEEQEELSKKRRMEIRELSEKLKAEEEQN
jgi:hypothetical protein